MAAWRPTVRADGRVAKLRRKGDRRARATTAMTMAETAARLGDAEMEWTAIAAAGHQDEAGG